MALPQKVLEQLGREPPKTPGWAAEFLMFSATIFFIALFIYLGIVFGYRPYLVSEVDKLESQIRNFGEQIPLEEQAKIINFYSQLINVRGLLSGHVISSGFFRWLESNTQANVYFERFDLNVSRNEVRLGGVASTMEDVNQQLAIFQSRVEVSRLGVSGISFANGAWRFDASLTLRPGFFRAAASP